MRKLIVIIGLLLAGVAFAQQSVQLRPGDGGLLWFDINSHAILPAHIVNTGQAPVPSACGGAGLAITGSDLAGSVTVGSSATTSCTITFNKTFTTAPTCIVAWPNGPLAAMSWTVTATVLTVTQTSTASNVLNYICIGKQ